MATCRDVSNYAVCLLVPTLQEAVSCTQAFLDNSVTKGSPFRLDFTVILHSRTVIFPNGSTIHILAASDPGKARGRHYDVCLADERLMESDGETDLNSSTACRNEWCPTVTTAVLSFEERAQYLRTVYGQPGSTICGKPVYVEYVRPEQENEPEPDKAAIEDWLSRFPVKGTD